MACAAPSQYGGMLSSHSQPLRCHALRTIPRWRRRSPECSRDRQLVQAAADSPALALLLSAPPDLQAATPEIETAVKSVVRDQPGAAGRKGLGLGDVLARCDGRWEVCYAPHILRLASPFGMKIRPLRYEFSEAGSRIRSVVRYSTAVGSGWFCTEGLCQRRKDEPSAVDVLFETFWMHYGETEPGPNPLTCGEPVPWDVALINAVGKAFFFAPLSRFPVAYIDNKIRLCVFEFPPRSTTIAARRV